MLQDVPDLISEMQTLFPFHQRHHHTAKWQDRQFHLLSHGDLKPGIYVAVSDFSENYTHLHKVEFQSKYYSQVQSTLYLMVVRVRVDDLKNIPAEEKCKLHELFDKEGNVMRLATLPSCSLIAMGRPPPCGDRDTLCHQLRPRA